MKTKVVISGSFRKHLPDIGVALANFRKAGIEVLAPLTQDHVHAQADFVRLTTDDPEKTADMLEGEFLKNIESADFLYLADVGGYVGKSMAAEAGKALIHKIPVVATEEMGEFSANIPLVLQDILKRNISTYLHINSIDMLAISMLTHSNIKDIALSLDEKKQVSSFVDDLLKELKGVKI